MHAHTNWLTHAQTPHIHKHTHVQRCHAFRLKNKNIYYAIWQAPMQAVHVCQLTPLAVPISSPISSHTSLWQSHFSGCSSTCVAPMVMDVTPTEWTQNDLHLVVLTAFAITVEPTTVLSKFASEVILVFSWKWMTVYWWWCGVEGIALLLETDNRIFVDFFALTVYFYLSCFWCVRCYTRLYVN